MRFLPVFVLHLVRLSRTDGCVVWLVGALNFNANDYEIQRINDAYTAHQPMPFLPTRSCRQKLLQLDIGTDNHYQWDAPAGASVSQVPFPHNQIPYIQAPRDGNVVNGYGPLHVMLVMNVGGFVTFGPVRFRSIAWWGRG